MGKFDGILICSDIDGTLIDDDFKIPKKNIEAIEYFKSEGGLFTLATGRTPQGMALYKDAVAPNAPIVCQNGAGIYDCDLKKYLWCMHLPRESEEIIRYVENKFPNCGIEVICEKNVYFVKENEQTKEHVNNEHFEYVVLPYKEIEEPWIKILTAEPEKKADVIENTLKNSEFALKYRLVRSYPTYYEIMEKSTNKGNAVLKLCELLGIEQKNVFVIGDNDNDAEMLSAVENSFAVASASELAKGVAGRVLKNDNNKGALQELIELIEKEFLPL